MTDRTLFTVNVVVEEMLIRGEGDARKVLTRQEQTANVMVSADRDKVISKADALTAYAFDLEGINTLVQFVKPARELVAARADALRELRRGIPGPAEAFPDAGNETFAGTPGNRIYESPEHEPPFVVFDEVRADFNQDAYEILETLITELNLAGLFPDNE